MKSEADELQSSVGYKNSRRREAEGLGALEGEQDAEELAGDNAEGDEGSHGPRPSVDLHARVHEHAEAQAEVHNDLPELLKLVERRGVQHDATIFVEFLHLERALEGDHAPAQVVELPLGGDARLPLCLPMHEQKLCSCGRGWEGQGGSDAPVARAATPGLATGCRRPRRT